MRIAPSVTRVRPVGAGHDRVVAQVAAPLVTAASLTGARRPAVGADERGELDEAVRVAPLVVVPGEHLHLRPVDDHRRERVDDRRARVVLVVDRDERPLLVAEDAGERPLRGGAQQRVDLLDRRRRARPRTRSRSARRSAAARGRRGRSVGPRARGRSARSRSPSRSSSGSARATRRGRAADPCAARRRWSACSSCRAAS